MAFANTSEPNLADFITFCQGQGVTAAALNPASDEFQWALTYALDRVPYVCLIPGIEWCLACYNLGLHWLITIAQDQTGLAMSSMAWANGLVTVTAAAATGYNAGQTFALEIVGTAPAAYNGTFTATVTGAGTFTYPLESNPGPVTAVGMFNMQFFFGLRKTFNLNSLVAGPVQTTGDQGTNTTVVVPEFFKQLTLEDLGLMQTPWGRRYLSYAQKAGPTVVGIS